MSAKRRNNQKLAAKAAVEAKKGLSPTHPSSKADSSHTIKSEKLDGLTRQYKGTALHGGETTQETVARLGHAGSHHTATGEIKNWDAANNKFMATVPNGSGRRQAGQSHTAAFSELIGAYTTFGLDPEQDNFDALDLMAQHIIDLLLTNVYTFANLTRFERNLLYRYFYKTNPIIHRCIDLHTDLPLSKCRLQKPSDLSDLASDFIMQFFNRVLERLNFAEFLRDFVLAHNIYGDATALVDDYYKDFDRVLQDISKLEDKIFTHSAEDEAFLTKVDGLYREDPSQVKLADRMKYIRLYFNTFYEKDYLGPDRISVVPFYKIQEFLENKDINYMAIKYQLSESLNKLMAAGVEDDFLQDVGYSEGMIATLNDPELRQDKTITIDTDCYDGMPFIINLQRPEGASNILCVLEQGLEWEASVRAMRAKIENIGKVGRVVFSEGLSESQTQSLRQEVHMMLEDPGYSVVANFKVEWNEVNTQVQKQLDDLIEASKRVTEVICLGLGMPIGLISGDTQYSGNVVKLEIVNVVYHSFKQRLQSLIEVALFRPLAIRKGFVRIDEWGNSIVCYPRLTFARISLRDESVYDLLFTLYQKDSLPVGIIYDILNLDTEDVRRGIEADMFTVLDPYMGEVIKGLMSANLGDVYQQSNVSDKIMKGLNLQKVKKENDSSGMGDFVSPNDDEKKKEGMEGEKPASSPEDADSDGGKPEAGGGAKPEEGKGGAGEGGTDASPATKSQYPTQQQRSQGKSPAAPKPQTPQKMPGLQPPQFELPNNNVLDELAKPPPSQKKSWVHISRRV